jgi:glycosyltransferase involved in cell wall biosynthesis
MKIAFDSQVFLHQKFGGISRYFTKLAECLHGSGEDVGIFAPFYLNSYINELPAKIVRGQHIPTACGRLNKWVEGPNLWLAHVRISRWKANIIHETYFGSKRQPSKSAPTVLTVYDMIHELFPEQFSVKDTTSIRKRQAVERADHVICISHQTKQDLIAHFGTAEDRVSVIHLGCDRPAEISAIASPQSEERPFILYVGHRGGYKNFITLLKAYASSSSLREELDLVAFGGGAFTSDEITLIQSLGIKNQRVRQIQGSDTMLERLYQTAHVVAYPSLYEGFGLPPLEAMAAGCPVVASDRSSIPEVVGDSAQYFDPESVDSIRDALNKATYDTTMRSQLTTKGFERVKKFSWEKCASETVNVYRNIANRSHP